jgi:ribose transport system substrate-binding protein
LRIRHQLLLIGALLVAVTTAACGSAAGVAPRTSAVDVAGARAALLRYERLPRFVAPGPAFDAVAAARGKTVFEIPITSEVPFITAVEQGMRSAADLVGAKLVVYRNQGHPAEWAQGIEQAIAQRAGVITLLAQDPRLVAPQIHAAESAGIPVVIVRATGETEPCPVPADGDRERAACIPGPFGQAGRLEADWVIADAGGKAPRILVLTSSDAPSTASLLTGLRSELSARCPGCAIRYIDVPIAQWADRIGTEVQSALLKDPDTRYVIPIYDSMSQFVKPGVAAAGLSGKVRVSTFNGTPFVLRMLQQNDLVAMDVGENLAWVGFATVDQAFRLLAGLMPVRSEHTPLRVFDYSNVADTGQPPALDQGYGDTFREGYERIWGLAR